MSDEEEEELPEPVKRPSKKTTAEPTGTIAAVVSQWAEDEEDDD
jgi:hypothetical protein